MRVFELAKKLDVSSKLLIGELAKLGFSAKNHMTTLDEKVVGLLIQRLRKRKEKEEAPPQARKAHVLIKRKKEPEEAPVAQVPAAPPISRETVAPVGLGEEPAPAPEIVAPSAVPIPEPATALEPSAAPVEPKASNKMGAPPVVPAAESRPAPPPSVERAPERQEKKPEKRIEEAAKPAATAHPGPGEPWKPPKKEVPLKFKEKPKKGKKPKWEPEVAPKTILPEVRTTWQDFKPLHRRDERQRALLRRSHAGPSEPAEITKPRRKVVRLTPGLTVKEFAELVGQRPAAVIGKLMEMGAMATINQPIDLEAAALLAEGFGVKAEVAVEKTAEDLLEVAPDQPGQLMPRPPVVTIMGHVDHGKTSLLDAIRLTKVTEGEAGGITQHIGAYTVKVGDRQVTFLDTPGHEAFTAMRARGAKATDIVILVVAADDGVMPQTLEAIHHAQAANVPIIVAINKIDKSEARPDRIKNTLAEHQLIPEAWGGRTIYAEVSAKKRIGLEALLEMILLQAEVLELRANPNKPARGVIIEAKLDRGRGPIATVLVQEGTLRPGDALVSGVYAGKVRALIDDLGQRVAEARPSTPVEVIGLEGVPQAGDTFVVVQDERNAKEIAAARMQRHRLIELSKYRKISLEDIYTRIKEGAVKELNLIIKADVQGSVEALRESLDKVGSDLVKVRMLHGGVGGVTETDVLLAAASNAIILAFNVRPDPKAQAVAEQEKVDIRTYDVIYDAIADVKAALEGLLEPTLKEKGLGRAEVRKVFSIPKVGAIAGCYVTDGTISRASSGARVIRDGVVVYDGKIGSLRRFKDDVREVVTGYECGIGIENFNDIKVGDVIEAYMIEKIAGKLE